MMDRFLFEMIIIIYLSRILKCSIKKNNLNQRRYLNRFISNLYYAQCKLLLFVKKHLYKYFDSLIVFKIPII